MTSLVVEKTAISKCGKPIRKYIDRDRITLGCLGADFYEYASVVAWMPLPEPYQEEQKGENET